MPARSRRQQRYLYATFGEAWVKAHHFDRLAPTAPKKGKKRPAAAKRRGRR